MFLLPLDFEILLSRMSTVKLFYFLFFFLNFIFLFYFVYTQSVEYLTQQPFTRGKKKKREKSPNLSQLLTQLLQFSSLQKSDQNFFLAKQMYLRTCR